MKGDFSRLVPADAGYSRVLLQQGRVMLDADLNGLTEVLLAAQRGLAADLIGPHGGPAADLGFAIATINEGGKLDVALGSGTYYVDGIRCTNPPPGRPREAVSVATQPFPPFEEAPGVPATPLLAYLDVWERHRTALQDDGLREVALGGPDTTSRTEVVWQVRVISIPAAQAQQRCETFDLAAFRATVLGTPPTLRFRARRVETTATDPCLSSPEARYTGPENQLYRVEIHSTGDEGGPTFVWSRENGSVVGDWTATEGDDLIVAGVRDTKHGFGPGDWVELTHDALELRGEHGPLVRLAAADGAVLTMDRTTATGPVESDPASLPNAAVRRWDQRGRADLTLVGGAVQVREGTGETDWIPLEDGVEVQFVPPAGGGPAHDYRVGDYWVAPARVVTEDVEWPVDAAGERLPLPPHGVRHHLAPLAVRGGRAAGSEWLDLRRRFLPLARCQNLQ